MKRYDDELHNTEDELDDIFSLEDNKLEKTIKKAKRHSIIRTVIISVIVVTILGIVSNTVFRGLVYRMEGSVQTIEDYFNDISAPNMYKGMSSRYHNILSGRTVYSTYKIIEGKVVYTGNKEYYYGLFIPNYGNLIGKESSLILGHSWEETDLGLRRFNELGQREMVFFYPYVNYSTVLEDLNEIGDIPDDKVMEYALSFDKSYSLEEVKGLLPKDVTLAWYWVDDISDDKKNELQAHTREQGTSNGSPYTVDYPPKVRSERKAYGIKAYTRDGYTLENPEEGFIRAIENGKELESRYQWQFTSIYDSLVGNDGTLTKEDLRIIGVIVTGNKESLSGLKGLPFIRSSSLGVVVDMY